jgi:Asp-tRNA(Asn)/Glu-tRNA(Gln) amidotransferase A subunit family amidase
MANTITDTAVLAKIKAVVDAKDAVEAAELDLADTLKPFVGSIVVMNSKPYRVAVRKQKGTEEVSAPFLRCLASEETIAALREAGALAKKKA